MIWSAQLLSNLLLLAGAVMLLASIRAFARTRQWRARVIPTEGVIVDCIEDHNESGVWYRAVYKYADVETDIVGGNHSVGVRPTLGDRVVIYYDPSYPTNAFLEKSKAPWFLPGCILVIALALLIAGFILRWPQSQVP